MAVATLTDIRLGWLVRFRSVARWQNFELAAEECHTDATCVSDSIQRLEEAMRQPLLIPGTALITAHGRMFLPRVDAILAEPGLPSRHLANVAFASLQALAALEEHGSYVAASNATGASRFLLMRRVKDLAGLIDEPLIANGSPLTLTPRGLLALSAARRVVSKLERCRGPETYFAYSGPKRRREPRGWWKVILQRMRQVEREKA